MTTSDKFYFERLQDDHFAPSEHVGGGWNPREQHIAPAIGLLGHAIEADRDRRRGGDLQLTRLSCDILGTIGMEPVQLTVQVLRPGRTIELVEARLSYAGRVAVIARAWLSQVYGTGAHAASGFSRLPPAEGMAAWELGDLWHGGFVRSLEARRTVLGPGRAQAWVRTGLELIAQEKLSPTARVLGLVDTANGLTPLAHPEEVAFPNLDLTAHFFRAPEGEWLGFDTQVSFGPSGAGLTHSVVHDQDGPFGTVVQTLTVRPR